MSNSIWRLAQFNVATKIAPLDSPELADFVAQLDTLNGLAEVSPGFVWRLKDDSGDSTDIRVPGESDLVLVNYSVWESIDQLFEFTFKSAHNDTMIRRREWFERHLKQHLVLWWIPADHTPTIDEAVGRLDALRENGPSERAFTMKERFAAPTAVDTEAAG